MNSTAPLFHEWDSTSFIRRLGRLLVASVLRCFATGMTRAAEVIQGRNNAAQRLYQQAGFRTSSCETWYHLWPNRR